MRAAAVVRARAQAYTYRRLSCTHNTVCCSCRITAAFVLLCCCNYSSWRIRDTCASVYCQSCIAIWHIAENVAEPGEVRDSYIAIGADEHSHRKVASNPTSIHRIIISHMNVMYAARHFHKKDISICTSNQSTRISNIHAIYAERLLQASIISKPTSIRPAPSEGPKVGPTFLVRPISPTTASHSPRSRDLRGKEKPCTSVRCTSGFALEVHL
ncbi:unnamed protein product [Trichogramma brassicae]|uniref:Uncharacterized protein n=1 Tax=Trichogramma brassicae TaxID=86971 RepID=A0A6H5I0I8_9HYME|nr:unnamed protein product [Trichogramma brassicae]